MQILYISNFPLSGTLSPYLRGISTGDFKDTLTPLLGNDAKNLSPNVISRLKTVWLDEYKQWKKRDLSKKEYVYIWADGIYLRARMEEAKDCVLVIIGVDQYGQKELIALEDGYRESKASWQFLLQDLKSRGLTKYPKVGVGDGALGFWAAVSEEFPKMQHQRCWVHKTCNVLDNMPKSLQARAKADLHEIWMSESRKDAYKAFDSFVSQYELKYPMVFKLCKSVEERWIKLNWFKRLGEVINGVKFVDGIKKEVSVSDDEAAA